MCNCVGTKFEPLYLLFAGHLVSVYICLRAIDYYYYLLCVNDFSFYLRIDQEKQWERRKIKCLNSLCFLPWHMAGTWFL